MLAPQLVTAWDVLVVTPVVLRGRWLLRMSSWWHWQFVGWLEVVGWCGFLCGAGNCLGWRIVVSVDAMKLTRLRELGSQVELVSEVESGAFGWNWARRESWSFGRRSWALEERVSWRSSAPGVVSGGSLR